MTKLVTKLRSLLKAYKHRAPVFLTEKQLADDQEAVRSNAIEAVLWFKSKTITIC